MTTINIQEESNPTKYLVITQQKDPETLITTRVLITDNANNRINVIDIGRGPVGPAGPVGPMGPKGNDGTSFDVLPISSGGTNNTSFTNNKIIYYDGNKLSSTSYSVDDLLNNANAITGIIEGSGIYKTVNGSSVVIGNRLGDGLTTDSSNHIIVDDTIARKYEINLGSIEGLLPINKGGTNSAIFSNNRLVYYDGSKLTSFPLETGRIVTSGSTISIVAGSGLVGGGNLTLPNGSVVINIGASEDIIVTDASISLSNTGIAGWYTKVLTDTKGRVVSGLSLAGSDVTNALGYVPWHAGNDGSGSLLDADLLDGRDGSFYLNYSNFTGTVQTNLLPDVVIPGTFTKVTTNSKGIVINGTGLNFADVVNGLNYIPFSTSGGTINGNVETLGNLLIRDGNVVFEDNLPLFSYDNTSMLPSDPRGFSFEYGSTVKRTGLLAYFPADQQLKLIVDIMDDGANDFGGGNAQDNFVGDIDGGNASSIFVLGSIVGEEAIVLLEHIADQKYVALSQNQTISGVKTFIDAVNIYNSLSIVQTINYNGPPLYVGNNSGLVVNFNSDYLDSNHGSFYRDAINLTGILSYQNTTVSNLEGTPNYIPKFNDLTNNPSRTISDSIIRQSGNDAILIENGSLSIGNNLATKTKTLSIGQSNTTTGNFSLAMGSGAYTWLDNQLAIGSFVEFSGSTPLGRGQTTLSAMGYKGETGGTYKSLSPTISIPKDRTILYNIDLVFSKLGSSGLAAISFHSGLIKNVNGNCYIIESGQKHELYNNSQIRDYLYTASGAFVSENQILSVTEPPMQHTSGSIQNLQPVYKIRFEPTKQSGIFNKLFNGDITLYLNEPVSSGRYTASSGSRDILVELYDHGCVTGCPVNFTPLSSTNILPTSGIKSVKSVPTKHTFIINDTPWIAQYKNQHIDILTSNIDSINNLAHGIPDYSLTKISSTTRFFLEGGSYAQTISRTGDVIITTSGYKIGISGFTGDSFISPINLYALFDATGIMQTTKKRNYDAEFTRSAATFDTYNLYYTQYQSVNNTGYIAFSGDIPISGYAPNYNPYFKFLSATNSFSGILTNGSNIVTECDPPQVGKLFSGMILYSSANGFPSTGNRISISPNDNTITLDVVYTGLTSNNNIVYSGSIPNDNYIILDQSSTGLLVSTTYVPPDSGIFVTGQAIMYNGSGNSNIEINPGSLCNLEPGTSGFIRFLSHSTGLRPVNGLYRIDIDPGDSKFIIKNYHLMPDSGVGADGTATLNLNKDHGFLPPSIVPTLSQDIPLSFAMSNSYPITSGALGGSSLYSRLVTTLNGERLSRKPHSGLYEIKAVTGYTVVISDFNRFLAAENNKDYFVDIPLKTSYQITSLNGNEISIKYNQKYFDTNDSLFLSFPAAGKYNQVFRITGIRDFGNYGFYDLRSATGSLSGFNAGLTGLLNYLGTCSGTIERYYNFFSFNYDGDSFEYWKRDSSGKYVDPPRTGYFVVYDSPSLCYSGQLCIHVTGLDTSGPGSLTGIRPQQPFYFDFIDGASELNGYYRVNDKINTNVLSLSIPYNSQLIQNKYWDRICHRGGLVHIINSTENIKTNKNPNKNNIFQIPNIQLSPESVNGNSIFAGNLKKFDSLTNKWKHSALLFDVRSTGSITGTINLTNQNNSSSEKTHIIFLNERPLFAHLQYGFTENTFEDIQSSTINVYTNEIFYLKIIVSGGAGKWSDFIDVSCPRINILGLKYSLFSQNRTFNDATQSWEIIVRCEANARPALSQNIEITISDISESITKNLVLNRQHRLKATPMQNVQYGYAGDIQEWFLLCEVYGGNLSSSNPPTVSIIDGFPDNSQVSVVKSYLNYPSGWWAIGLRGLPSNSVQTFQPVIGIQEEQNTTETIYVTGTLNITDVEQMYDISIRTLFNNTNISYSDSTTNFGFLVPALTKQDSDFNVTMSNLGSLSLGNFDHFHIDDIKCYAYRANIVGPPGYYQPSITIDIKQPSGTVNRAPFNKTQNTNITIYNPISIDLSQYSPPLVFKEDTPWHFTFYVTDGGSSHRSDYAPEVFINKTPSIGTYNFFPLEYVMYKQYDPIEKRWIVYATGLPDQFGNMASSTGIYNLGIYVEDYTTSHSENFQLRIDPSTNLFISDYSYATPNNGFEFHFDLYAPESTSAPTIDFPESLRDSSIVPILSKAKYDKDINLWEYAYSGLPLIDKWDAKLELDNNNLTVKAKGILNDKIYVAGKLETIETESAFSTFAPLRISGLKQTYEVIEGNSWSLQFSTIGGLENPLYPPRINMTGFPATSLCAGYDPATGDNQAACFQNRTWNNTNKSWTYNFSGFPLCISNAKYNISIDAIDVVKQETFSSDNAKTVIEYKQGDEHPAPILTEGNFGGDVFPDCTPYSASRNYNVSERKLCPSPTGITGVMVTGSLPPGLTFTDSRSGEYKSPWSDLTGGKLTIEGTVSSFADGGPYPQKFGIIITDARGKKQTINNIEFKDASEAIAPSPIDMTIYFSGLDYVYSPAKQVGKTTVLGGNHIQDMEQDMLQPPIADISMQCSSRLPHNNCLYSTGLYSFYDTNNIMLSGYGTAYNLNQNRLIYNNDKIYVKFEDDILPKKEYIAKKIENTDFITITIPNHSIPELTSGSVEILKTQNSIQPFSVSEAKYGGKPPCSVADGTITGIMGDGKYTTIQDKKGFQGRFKPAFTGAPVDGLYSRNFKHHGRLSVSSLSNDSTSGVYAIKFFNCYETGYLRVSGVILPKPTLEITDPAPANILPFAYDNQQYSFSVRIAHGNTENQRNQTDNYILFKEVKAYVYSPQTTGYNITLPSITTLDGPFQQSLGYQSPTINSGLVFGIAIRHDSTDTFPTYNKYAIPSLENQYFWIQRASGSSDEMTETTFPPHVPVYSGNIFAISGNPISQNINIVGGYIPVPSIAPFSNWQYDQYLHSISGYIQTPINNNFIQGTYQKLQGMDTLTIFSEYHPYKSGDVVVINAYKKDFDYSSILPFNYTGIILNNIVGDNIYITGFPTNVSMTGDVKIRYAAAVSSGSSPFQIRVDHGSGQSGYYRVNQTIDIASVVNDQVSTQNYLMPRNVRLNVVSGTSSYFYAGIDAIVFSGVLTQDDNVINNLTINPQHILKPGYKLYCDTPNFTDPIIVSDVTENSIILSSNWSGETTNLIQIIHSGDETLGYYDGLLSLMSGISYINENIYNNNNLIDINFGAVNTTKIGYTNATITGYSNNLKGNYLYKVITSENSNLPTITNYGWANKKFSRIYDLISSEPLRIISDNTVFSNISLSNNSWTLQFAVTGGFIPKSGSNLVVEIDDYIHTFSTDINYVSDSGALITVISNTNIDWNQQFINTTPTMRIFDKTGSEYKALNANFGV